MGEVVNLRRERKRAGRKAAEVRAGENRVLNGLPKAERDLARRQAETAARRLDGHRVGEPPPDTLS